MITSYCPHCQTVRDLIAYHGTYNIALCSNCRNTLSLPEPHGDVPDYPDAAREDIDAPLPSCGSDAAEPAAHSPAAGSPVDTDATPATAVPAAAPPPGSTETPPAGTAPA